MGKVIRQTTDIGENLKAMLAINKMQTKVGWGESAKYEDGTPVAYVAAIQEYGSTHMHPGGTKYVVKDGKTKFVSNSFSGEVAGVTKPHQIVIPPRSFMRTTATEKNKEWAAISGSGAKAVLAGNATAHDVMEGLGLAAQGDIKKKILSIQDPPLKKSTINNRLKKLADGKTVGNLTKPLVESSHMVTTLDYTVE